ncbi:MAG TPA: 2-succinyl-5-enolpyruvyl-6-hydroxy-3-cyclohexene-1-carboxylic-acid synthase [Sporichthyaceae bacterium]|nr:2-succinyl-5-enolpyruvyl-6-hydroxy-3-cyclohexene-1-carboxylic-acid synthase [Sporichthyaceae bacterium]
MNPSTALARVLVDELVRCGVTEAVLAPGSRSAPLALALYREDRIRLHVRIDERSAAYLAIGLARVSGRPVPVVCTSGTAAAALHPAVLEADLGNVPLLVLTADRPPELRGTGASQTVDQLGLYGRAVRMFAEVGVPEPVVGQVGYWRSLVGRAVAAATGTAVGGPVHLNLAFREPLVPDGDPSWPESLEGREDGAVWVWVDRIEPASMPVSELLGEGIPERGAIVAGDGVITASSVVSLAEHLGWPLFAEPTSNCRLGPNAIAGYPLLLADEAFAEDPPDVVFTVGRPSLSRPLLRWLGRAGTQIVMDSRPVWPDPTRSACRVIPRTPWLNLDSVADTESAWLGRWRRAGRAACAVLDAERESARLTEVGVAGVVGAALPAGGLLICGPSRPIRDVELTLPARDDITVVANRGVNGIDGLVSTAIGAALAHQHACGGVDGPAVALLGDLTYLYDRNGLLLAPEDPRPDLVLVVVDNDGGGIFGTLPQAGLPGFERLFGTPHGIDLCADAAVAGIPAVSVTTAHELTDAIREGSGIRLVRVPTDRADAAKLQIALQEAVGAALRP